MCEANAYIYKNGTEEMFLESVDIVEPEEDGGYRLVSIFGEQKKRDPNRQHQKTSNIKKYPNSESGFLWGIVVHGITP